MSICIVYISDIHFGLSQEEASVIVNHARKSTKELMIERSICYLRAGDSKGSLLVKPGFDRLQYVLIHTNGEDTKMYKLKIKALFKYGRKKL